MSAVTFPFPPGVARLISTAARTTLPALILGEPGTECRAVARAIHREGGGPEPTFVALTCRGLTAERLQAALTEGTATVRTLLIEDLDQLDAQAQHLLLLFLEEPPPSGEATAVRVLGAAPAGRLDPIAPDLLHRLGPLRIVLPPLRERREAIPDLVAAIVKRLARLHGLRPRTFTPMALARLQAYPWPYNLVELEATVARTLALAQGETIDEADLLLAMPAQVAPPPATTGGEAPGRTVEPAREVEGIEILRLVGHELRNPLVTVKTFAQLLPERFDDPAFRGRFYESLLRELDRMERLLEILAGYARLSARAAQPVDLPALLRRTLSAWEWTFQERGAQVRLEPGEARSVQVDPEYVEFALHRLWGYVSEVMDPEGGLTVTVAPQQVTLSYVPRAAQGAPADDAIERRLALFLARRALEEAGWGLDLTLSERQATLVLRLPG